MSESSGFFQRNEDAMTQEKDRVEKQASEWGNNADMLYLMAGSTMVRILPAYSDAGKFFRKITRHRTRTSDGTFIGACPAVTEDLPCALCEKAQELKDSGDPVKLKFVKDNLRPQDRYLYNVLVYSAPADSQGQSKEFGKVYVMEAGIMVHRQLISLDTDAMVGWADITNLNNGVNVVIKRTGSGLDTKYEVSPTGHGRSDVVADFQARGLNPQQLQPVNLDLLYTLPPDEKLAEVVAGLRVGATPSPQGQFPVQAPAMQPVVPQSAPVAAPPLAAPPVASPPVTPPVGPGPQVPTAAPGAPMPVTTITSAPVKITQTVDGTVETVPPGTGEIPAPAVAAPQIPAPPKTD